MEKHRITHSCRFIDGANYQLHYGFDFGDNKSIPGLGLHHAHRMEQVKEDFALLATNGIHSVRMNVFTDGRSGIVYDTGGRALGVQDSVSEGLVNVLRAAEDNHIAVSLVMLDHKFAERAEWIDARKPGLGTKQGHARNLVTRTGQAELLSNVLTPLLRDIGRANIPSLLSVELVNEPESLIEGFSTDTNMQMLVRRPDLNTFKAFMRSFRDVAHRETGAQFTVGSLALKHSREWLEVLDPAFDYLSIHYYGLNDEPPYRSLYKDSPHGDRLRKVKGLQERIPVVWGEYAANGSSDFLNEHYPQSFSSALQFLEDALANNMKGAYAWAMRSGLGEWGDLFGPVPLEQHRAFTALHASRIELLGVPQPVFPPPMTI